MATKDGNLTLDGIFPLELKAIEGVIGQKYEFHGEIDRGKTGIAYKLKSIINNHFYCLKTISPDIKPGKEFDKVKDALKKEVDILLPLDHRCVPRIYERLIDSDLPFYVCTFHPGATWEKFKTSGEKIGLEKSVFLIWSLMDALEYIHDKGRTHCDLHQKNILVSKEVFQHGILIIDFGSGHRETSTTPTTPDRGNVLLKAVQHEGSYGETDDRKNKQAAFRSSDFAAVGHLLARMQGCFFHDATPAQLRAYQEFCLLLENHKIDTWTEARGKFLSVIDPFRAVSISNRLFTSSERYPQAIPLPVSRLVAVGDAPLKIINTRIFQRLRGVKQLSFCEWRFPGATHNRFEHSLGVFNTVKKAVDNLIHNESFRSAFDADDIKGLLLASLVHDVGHYPFAHVLEQYTKSRLPESKEANEIVSHSHNTIHLLEQDRELNEAIKRNWGESALQRCIKILNKQGDMLSDIIDSAIDCDKIDYLMRDSLHCGVTFGNGLDIEGLLRAYCPVQNCERLGISELGIASVEGLMVLQHQMLSTVYWHQTVRSITCMFHAVFAHLIGRNFEKLRDFATELKLSVSDNHALTNVIIQRILKQKEAQEQLSQLVDFQINPDYSKIYSPICVYRPNDKPPRTSHFNIHSTIFKSSHQSTSDSSLPIDWKAIGVLRQAFTDSFNEKKIKMDARQLVVDVPYGKGSHRPIIVQDTATGSEAPIIELSHLKNSIFEQPAAFVSPIRVYIAPELKAAAGANLQSIIISAEVKFHTLQVSEVDQTPT